ncbi:60S ribosomal subunit assembly/export protein loc1 [Phyllosticta citriasiana]|uniref:60S ribosomal subunit assembly/export protein loc1 n=1 Tax=Phyllosticta citriasiana TaxID=595635 RepID=UPI0030FD9E8A
MAPVKSSKGKGAPAGSSKNKSQKKRNVTHNPDGTVKVAVGKAKKERTYTESQLGIPKLNMITPAGVQKGKGKKKGKVFVDDQQSMMTILAMVNAEKEGQIESKLMRARQMEEIREARRKEAEARQEQKKTKLARGNQGIAPPQKEAENF